ncbi:MAG TPA: CoA transferase [Ktedonobacterales bacterium]|nr:CoA transferase [Ktedonobacterales bacterium]
MTTTPDTTWENWAQTATDPLNAMGKPEALDGVVVMDLSRGNIGGMVCSSILSEFGAEVIRLESPEGDPARGFTPYGQMHEGVGLGYLVEARNKHHITLRLESSEGQSIFRRLVRHADIVIETFAPGVLGSWGLAYAQLRQLNPRLIWAAQSTYGHFGPRASTPIADYDITDQALSGLTYFNGERVDPEQPHPCQVPTKAGSWLAWYVGGVWSAFGVLAALLFRNASGEGQLVDVSPPEGLARFLDFNLTWYHAAGQIRERIGSLDATVFPYTFVRCKDGYTFLAGFSDTSFARLAHIMGRPELAVDPRFDSVAKRTTLETAAELMVELEAWTARFTAEEILNQVQRDPGTAPVVTGRVNTPLETFQEENWWVRGALQRVDDPMYGEVVVQGPPWKMSETPPRIKWLCRPVGHDNERIYLQYLGLGTSQLHDLRARGII